MVRINERGYKAQGKQSLRSITHDVNELPHLFYLQHSSLVSKIIKTGPESAYACQQASTNRKNRTGCARNFIVRFILAYSNFVLLSFAINHVMNYICRKEEMFYVELGITVYLRRLKKLSKFMFSLEYINTASNSRTWQQGYIARIVFKEKWFFLS